MASTTPTPSKQTSMLSKWFFKTITDIEKPIIINNQTRNAKIQDDSSPAKLDCDQIKRNNEQQKSYILKEIINSEKKYLNDIKEIIEGYHNDVSLLKDRDNSKESILLYQIFCNLKNIYEFTIKFNDALNSNEINEINVAKCFIDNHEYFLKLYSIYCTNLRLTHDFIETIENDKIIGKKIQVKFIFNRLNNTQSMCL
jgi:hypothetical protein